MKDLCRVVMDVNSNNDDDYDDDVNDDDNNDDDDDDNDDDDYITYRRLTTVTLYNTYNLSSSPSPPFLHLAISPSIPPLPIPPSFPSPPKEFPFTLLSSVLFPLPDVWAHSC